MAKVIRTVRISGPVVTLGQAESSLYLREGEEGEASAVDLEAILQGRAEALAEELEGRWQARLEDELGQAEAAAAQRLQEAEARWEGERQQLHAERYEEGRQAGIAEKEQEVHEAVERLDAVHRALGQERAKVLRDAEQLVVDVALALGRKVTGMQAEADPRVLARVMRTALENLAEHSQITVKVHPDDLDTARRFAARWVERVAEDAVLRVRPSRHVDRGGCLVETPEEQLDARLEAQFSVLGQALREAAKEDTPAENAPEKDDDA